MKDHRAAAMVVNDEEPLLFASSSDLGFAGYGGS